jgi:simple sugar transport system ATP-binding protein
MNRGRSMGDFRKSEISNAEVATMMAGGEELRALEEELAEFGRPAVS